MSTINQPNSSDVLWLHLTSKHACVPVPELGFTAMTDLHKREHKNHHQWHHVSSREWDRSALYANIRESAEPEHDSNPSDDTPQLLMFLKMNNDALQELITRVKPARPAVHTLRACEEPKLRDDISNLRDQRDEAIALLRELAVATQKVQHPFDWNMRLVNLLGAVHVTDMKDQDQS